MFIKKIFFMYWMSKHSYLDICVTFADRFFKLLTITSNKLKKKKNKEVLVQGFVYK